MNQKQMAELFATSIPNINIHINNILKESELDANSVVKDYLTTASDGKRYEVTFYSLDMILAVGFRVRSKRGTQFRQWANRNLREYMIKGFVMDDERLKNPNGCPDYFDELLARIRDIRASEKRFYQNIRYLFALSSDYDKTDKATPIFFAETQNKLIYAVTGKTAAELMSASITLCFEFFVYLSFCRLYSTQMLSRYSRQRQARRAALSSTRSRQSCSARTSSSVAASLLSTPSSSVTESK